jgi:hypothetical protein
VVAFYSDVVGSVSQDNRIVVAGYRDVVVSVPQGDRVVARVLTGDRVVAVSPGNRDVVPFELQSLT